MEKTIGEILKEIRIKKGIDLDTISQKTNISSKKLNSLESNIYSHFPGKFYFVSYIKEYLKAINHEEPGFFENLSPQIDKIQFKKPSAQVQFSKIRYLRFKKKKIYIILLAVLIALGIIYLLFFNNKLNIGNIFGQLLSYLKQ